MSAVELMVFVAFDQFFVPVMPTYELFSKVPVPLSKLNM